MTIKNGSRPPEASSSNDRGAWRLVAAALSMAVTLAAVAFGAHGCGKDADDQPAITKQAVRFEDVPENVRTAATKAIPGVKFNEAWKNLERDGKLHSYEIRGKNPSDGKTREARVSVTGEILEME